MRVHIWGCQNTLFLDDDDFECTVPSQPWSSSLGAHLPSIWLREFSGVFHNASDPTAGFHPSRQAESRCHSAWGTPRCCLWTSEALRVMAHFQQSRGPYGEPPHAEIFCSPGYTYMVLWYVVSGKQEGMEIGGGSREPGACWRSHPGPFHGLAWQAMPCLWAKLQSGTISYKKQALLRRPKHKFFIYKTVAIGSLIGNHTVSPFISISAWDHFIKSNQSLKNRIMLTLGNRGVLGRVLFDWKP